MELPIFQEYFHQEFCICFLSAQSCVTGNCLLSDFRVTSHHQQSSFSALLETVINTSCGVNFGAMQNNFTISILSTTLTDPQGNFISSTKDVPGSLPTRSSAIGVPSRKNVNKAFYDFFRQSLCPVPFCIFSPTNFWLGLLLIIRIKNNNKQCEQQHQRNLPLDTVAARTADTCNLMRSGHP